MRRSLWIVPVLFATMVIPYAKADSISDANTATPLDPVTYKFKCCGGATGITDLDVVYSRDVSGDKNFTFTLSMLSPPCTPVIDKESTILLCKEGDQRRARSYSKQCPLAPQLSALVIRSPRSPVFPPPALWYLSPPRTDSCCSGSG